jgi:hypothetical protein
MAMTSWQIKGLLLLGSALAATALAASTSGATSKTSADPADRPLRVTEFAERPSAVDIVVIKPPASWHDA